MSTASHTGSLLRRLSLLRPTSASPTLSPVAFGLLWNSALLCKSGCGGGGAADDPLVKTSSSHNISILQRVIFKSGAVGGNLQKVGCFSYSSPESRYTDLLKMCACSSLSARSFRTRCYGFVRTWWHCGRRPITWRRS